MDLSQKFKQTADGKPIAPLCEAATIGITACEYLVGNKWCNSPHPCGSKLRPDGKSQSKMDAFLGEMETRTALLKARQRMQGVDDEYMAELDYLDTLERIAETPTTERRNRHEVR